MSMSDRVGSGESTLALGAPPLAVSTRPGEIHVWMLPLDRPPVLADELASSLSPAEQERANRFRFDVHRRRFVIGRGLHRHVLASYLGIPAREVRFSVGRRGKPYLASARDLSFNYSSSADWGLLAVGDGRELGVDIEQIRPLNDLDLIARHAFAAGEQKALRALPDDQRVTGFFNCWTRKEAFVKALADGLYGALDRFEVSLAPGEPACLLGVAPDIAASDHWRMVALPTPPRYAGALVAEGWDWTPVCWCWEQGSC